MRAKNLEFYKNPSKVKTEKIKLNFSLKGALNAVGVTQADFTDRKIFRQKFGDWKVGQREKTQESRNDERKRAHSERMKPV